MVQQTATTTETTTSTKTGPFDYLTLVRFEKVSAEGTRMVRVLTTALLRRINCIFDALSIEFSKTGKVWNGVSQLRFNRLRAKGDNVVSVTFQWEGLHEITANLVTGVRTVEILSYIRKLLSSGEILKRSSLDAQITAIEEELSALEQSRVVPMVMPLIQTTCSATPMFGMEHIDFIQYLQDIHGHIQHESVISLKELGEVSDATPTEKNPPQGQQLDALFEWLKGYRCIYEPKGLSTTNLNGITLKVLIEYYGEKGEFPEMPGATTTATLPVVVPVQKRKYNKRKPESPVVATVPTAKKAPKPRRRSLRQIMAEFDLYFMVPLMRQLREKFDTCIALVSKNLSKARKVFAEIEKLEAKLTKVRSQRNRFEKMMQEFINSLK